MNIVEMPDEPTKAFQEVVQLLPLCTYAELLLIADAMTAMRNNVDRKNGVLAEVIKTGKLGEAHRAACRDRRTMADLMAA